MNNLHTVSALSGNFKTTSAIQHSISQLRQGNKVLFVLPSKDLIDQVKSDIINVMNKKGYSTYRIHSIYSKDKSDNVSSRLHHRLRRASPKFGQILLITHQAFLIIQKFFHKEEWTVIIDEIPQIEELVVIKSKKEIESIDLNSIEKVKSDFEGYLELKLSKENKTKFNKSLGLEMFYPISSSFKSLLEAFKYGNRKILINESNTDGRIGFIIIRSPDLFIGFSKITIMSAHLEQSLFYHIMLKQGFTFCEDSMILNLMKLNISGSPVVDTQQQLSQIHENCENVLIYHPFDRHWSKSFRNKILDIDQETCTPLDLILVESIELLKKEKFIFSLNTDIEETYVTEKFNEAQAVRISGFPHGLNTFRSFNHIVYLSATNPPPVLNKFFKVGLGLTESEIRTAFYYLRAYQAVLRTSIRDTNNNENNLVVVPDKGLAEFLQKLFEGSEIKPLGNYSDISKPKGAGRPNDLTSENAADRQYRKRAYSKLIKECARHQNKDMNISIYSGYDVLDLGLLINLNEHKEDFVEVFKEYSEEQIDDKNSTYVIRPSSFRDTPNEENVEYSSLLCLDIDNTEMTPQDINLIFSDYEYILHNTYTGKGRFRVLFFISQPISGNSYKFLMYQLKGVIEENGFRDSENLDCTNPVHGIDKTALHASRAFYFPCLPSTNDTEDKFFIHNEGESIDPIEWIEKPKIKLPLDTLEKIVTRNRRQRSNVIKLTTPIDNNLPVEQINNAISKYQRIQKGSGERYQGFFNLGLRLFYLLNDISLTESYLNDADYDGSRQLKNHIYWVCKKIEDYKNQGKLVSNYR